MNSSAPHRPVTERTWPSRAWRSSRRVLASEAQVPLAGEAGGRGAHGLQVGSSGSQACQLHWPPFLPSLPLCTTASSLLAPVFSFLATCIRHHSFLRYTGTVAHGGASSVGFSHTGRSQGRCATSDEPIRRLGVPESISNFRRRREHPFP